MCVQHADATTVASLTCTCQVLFLSLFVTSSHSILTFVLSSSLQTPLVLLFLSHVSLHHPLNNNAYFIQVMEPYGNRFLLVNTKREAKLCSFEFTNGNLKVPSSLPPLSLLSLLTFPPFSLPLPLPLSPSLSL